MDSESHRHNHHPSFSPSSSTDSLTISTTPDLLEPQFPIYPSSSPSFFPNFANRPSSMALIPRFFSSDDAPGAPRHFLDSCHLCKKPLGTGRDIFMYRGDTPFCSEECRQEQIEMDEANEKRAKKMSKSKQNGGGANKSESGVQVRASARTVVAG